MNKKQWIVFALAAGALVVPQTALAAGFANTSHSATAVGMGTVGTANLDEPNVNFFNPAGMAFQDSWNIYVGGTMLAPSVDYESPDGSITEQTESQIFLPPNISVAVPVTEDISVGLGATFPWGLGIEWPDDWVGAEEFRSQSLETANLMANVAYDVPGIDLGVSAGVQVLRSAVEQRRLAVLPDGNEVDVQLGGTGTGIGLSAGAMYRATDDVTLGLSYRSAATIDYEGRAHFSDGAEGTPFQQRFVDQDITTQITVPHVVNAGVGYQLLEELWLGFDVNYMSWRTYDELVIEYAEQSPEGAPGSTDPPTVVRADWEDAVAFRLGGQYQITDQIKGRLGVGLDMTPVPDETVGPSLPDNDRYIASVGLGYETGGFRADAAYQMIALPTRTIDNDTVDGDYQLFSHTASLNVGYGF